MSQQPDQPSQKYRSDFVDANRAGARAAILLNFSSEHSFCDYLRLLQYT